jgi:hypothetical protein
VLQRSVPFHQAKTGAGHQFKTKLTSASYCVQALGGILPKRPCVLHVSQRETSQYSDSLLGATGLGLAEF